MENYAYQNDETNGKQQPAFAITRYPPSPNGPNDYLVEVNSRSKLFRQPRFYKRLSILLLIIALIFLIAFIILITLYFKNKGNSNICTTNECLRTAFNMKYSLDLSVDPCDDFYQYTCGKWSEEHPNHGWFPSFSAFSTITEKISIAIVEFLTSESEEEDEPISVRQSRDFYKSCMDVDSINNLGLSVIQKTLKEVGLPQIPSLFTIQDDQEKLNFKFDWLKMEAVLKKTFFMDLFVGFLVDNDIYNMTQNVMYIGSIGQKCPLPSPFQKTKKPFTDFIKSETDDADSSEEREVMVKKTRANIIKFVIKTLMVNASLEEPKEDDLILAADVINNMTTFIDELTFNYTGTELLTTPTSFKDLQKKTDEFMMNNINKNYPDVWLKYVTYLFEGTNVTLDAETDLLYVVDFEEPFLHKILTYLMDTSEIYIELYMWWAAVYAMIINTSYDVVDYISKQTAPYYGTATVTRSRSLDCASLVNNFMGMAISYGIADRSFLNNTKPKVEQMLHDIKDAFVEHVNNIHWMDKKTKQVTLEKSIEMLSFIGYPDWLFKNGSLDENYKGIVIKPDTYLENMLSFVKNYLPEALSSLRRVNKRDWKTDPTSVNAFNSFQDNAINVPFAILNYPMYNLGLEVLNYGSIGSILGHELTHGFDNIGRKHDKYGNYIQWWSNETIETFEKMTECFVEQYNNYTLDGVEGHVLGDKTLGENLADNGGLNQAFTAYKKYTKKFEKSGHQKLPGFENFTDYQMFFIAYGSIWCETSSPEELQNQLEYDEHCPNSIRVIGTLQNSEDFASAFKCKKGTKMNPHRKKCKIW